MITESERVWLVAYARARSLGFTDAQAQAQAFAAAERTGGAAA